MAVYNDRTPIKIDAVAIGGSGFYYREPLVEGVENLGETVKYFAKITVLPGTVMKTHQHTGDYEVYYIIQGEGEYDDNGTIVPAYPGCVFQCKDGECHGITNTGKEDLVFIALIVSTE